MLTALSISNYAIIENLEVSFDKGFSVITGETGAGKSILLGALGLVLGNRADTQVLNNKEKKCIIEAVFNIEGYNLKPVFEKYDLDYETVSIIRREINKTGKSRAFVNDTPVTLTNLKEIALKLIDIHSQHQTLQLNESGFQLELLDAVSENQTTLENYKNHFKAYKKLKEELQQLKASQQKANQDIDYYEFQLKELLEANLSPNEQEEAETELSQLENAEEIKEKLYYLTQVFDDEKGLLSLLKSSENELAKLSSISSKYEGLYTRLSSSIIELQDIFDEIDNLKEEVDINPEKIQLLQERLDLIYALQNKHSKQTISDLLEYQNELEQKLNNIGDVEYKILEAEKLLEKTENELNEIGKELSKKRIKGVDKLVKKTKIMLSEVALSKAYFEVELKHHDTFSETGMDTVQFLFSANAGIQLSPLNKVASGGELSRLMLVLKTILSEKKSLPTIIFDEIDTGVSGDVANKVGNAMKQMSKNMQVFAITHLPQVAGKGDAHYKVYKQEQNGKTISTLKLLNKENRIVEIASMLSGEEISEAAKQNARELLMN